METLERAVVAAAAAIAGPKSAAILCARENDRLVTRATHGISGDPSIRDWGVVEQLLAGSGVLVESAPPGWKAGGLLAVPMFLEGAVVGALGVITAPQALPKHDEQALLFHDHYDDIVVTRL